MTAQTVNVLVRSLEAGGYVRRSRHPTHGRILLLFLTPAGRRALKRGLAVALGIQDRLLSGLSASDSLRLRRLLQEIEQASDQGR